MSTDQTYQGWTNRETWALMLHINNDQGLYEMFRSLAAEHAEDPDQGRDAIRTAIEQMLNPAEYREEYGTAQPPAVEMMAHEVGSVWRVDWAEVIASLREA